MTEGLLQEIRLAEVIQLIFMSEKTGDLELMPLYPARQARKNVPVGHLYFRDGHIHAAMLADRVGESAAENLFLWEAGFFNFRALPPHELPPANIHCDSQSLILRGVERLDRWKSAREMVPTLRAVLRRKSPTPAATLPELHTPEGLLLAQCDGATQLIDIAPRLNMGWLRCREAAAKLLSDGLVAYGPTSAGEKLVKAVIVAAMPLLGVAADLFCEDALRVVGIAPETVNQIQSLSVAAVTQVIREIEREVVLVLGAQRGADIANRLAAGLGIAVPATNGKEIHHV